MPQLSLEDFSKRFVERAMRHAKCERDGDRIKAYAERVCQTYWIEVHSKGSSPEECADDDMSYWDLDSGAIIYFFPKSRG